MAFQISPGVNVTEIDLTTIIPQVSTTDGALAGAFQWGPLNEINLVGSEDELVALHGAPNNDTAIDFFTAAAFLEYGNKLRVVRVADEGTALNATADGTGLLIKNDEDYDANYAAGQGSVGHWAAQHPGERGNGLKVSICSSGQAFRQTRADLKSTGIWLHESKALSAGDDLEDVLEPETLVKDDDTSGSGEDREVASVTSGTSELLTTSGTAISGSGTSFLTTLHIGMMLDSGGERRVVTAIADDENATLDAAFTADVTVAAALPTLSVALNAAFTVDLPGGAGNDQTLEWKHAALLAIAPGTSPYAQARGGSNDEIHVVIVDGDGVWSGVKNQVLEVHDFLSLAADARSEDGASSYYAEVINRTSAYIRWMDHPNAGINWGTNAQGTSFDELPAPITESLSGGVDGNSLSDADKIRGFDLFDNAEEVDVSLILGSDASLTVAQRLIAIAEDRKDCLACISPRMSDVVQNPGNELQDVLAFRGLLPSTSYAVMDSGWKLRFDKYNDTDRWVPLNGDTAGLMVRTDNVSEPWFSPAGLNRGIIRSVKKLAWSPRRAQRDDLYLRGVNSVILLQGQGNVLWGDKTMLLKPSAFDRINVRRLFIVLEKAIATAAKFTLFELNDEFTRAQFRHLVEPFLDDVKGRRGITDFRVVADETNNTPEVIDRNEFVGDIYIKPARSINFIQLNFVAVRTGVDFSEIVGQF